jgi:hypothetical protein
MVAAVIGIAFAAAPVQAAQMLSITITPAPSGSAVTSSTSGNSVSVGPSTVGNFNAVNGTSTISNQTATNIGVDLSGGGNATLSGGLAVGGSLTFDLTVSGLNLSGALNALESITGDTTGGNSTHQQTIEEQLKVNGSTILDQTFTATNGNFTIPTPNMVTGTVNAGAGPITLDLVVIWTVPAGTPGDPTFGVSLSSDARGGLQPTPEPSSIMCALTSLPVLGLVNWVRRRKAKA